MSYETPDVRTETRSVTVEYLDELYAKADVVRAIVAALEPWAPDRLPCICEDSRFRLDLHDETCSRLRSALAAARRA